MNRGNYVVYRVLPFSVASLLALYSSTIELFTFSRLQSGILLFVISFALFFIKFVAIQLELRRVDKLTNSSKWTYYLINHIFLPVASYLLLFILGSFINFTFLAVLFGVLFLLTLFYDDILVLTYQDSGDDLHRAHFVFDFFKIFNIYLFALLLANIDNQYSGISILLSFVFLIITFFIIKLTLYKSEKISKFNLVLTSIASILLASVFIALLEYKVGEAADISLSVTAFFIVTTLFLTKVADREVTPSTVFRYLLAYSAVALLAIGI